MTTKLGRNDPCACGSGKKFKHCCMGKPTDSSGLPWPTFDEEFVIAKLLQSSVEFAAYYEAERVRIPRLIHWAKDTSLPAGIDYRSTQLGPGVYVVRLRRVPAVLSDAMKIAHELHHLVLWAEGFPVTGATRENETLSSSLNSMVHDPLVNTALQEYGFDPLSDYQTELKETFRQLRRQPTAPDHHLGRMFWIFNYVGKVLDWKAISLHAGAGADMFRLWFDKRYPALARDAHELLGLVEKIGYDTPEKQAQLFREIIRTYDLAGYIVF